jgi:hypothetical protein
VVWILFDKPLLHVIEHHAIVKRGLQHIIHKHLAIDKGYAFLGFSDFHDLLLSVNKNRLNPNSAHNRKRNAASDPHGPQRQHRRKCAEDHQKRPKVREDGKKGNHAPSHRRSGRRGIFRVI